MREKCGLDGREQTWKSAPYPMMEFLGLFLLPSLLIFFFAGAALLTRSDYMTKPFEFTDLYRLILALSPPVFTAV
jgi:hypothetical protein